MSSWAKLATKFLKCTVVIKAVCLRDFILNNAVLTSFIIKHVCNNDFVGAIKLNIFKTLLIFIS